MSTPNPHPSIWVLLDQAYRSVNRLLARNLAESGHSAVRASHGPVFENIAPSGSHVTDMANRAGITKQSMSQFVRELEQHGYLARRPDPADGRAQLVLLTAKGRRAVSIAFDGLQQLQRHVEQTIGNREVELLHKLLAELANYLAGYEASLGSRTAPRISFKSHDLEP